MENFIFLQRFRFLSMFSNILQQLLSYKNQLID